MVVDKIKSLFHRILGIKLRYQMFLVYILGGALPIILVGIYLVRSTSRILVEQAEYAEVTEMEMARRQVEEALETVSTVTKYFYFDPQLEEIASKQYD